MVIWPDKKIISIVFILSLLSMAFLVIGTTSVAAAQDGDYTYSTNGSPAVATVTGYTGTGGAITIPSTLGGCVTVAIGDSAFSYGTMTSVIIPDGVQLIGNFSFDHCTAMTSVTIPNSVTWIGYGAFDHCIAMTSATIPIHATFLGNYSFSACITLASVTIPDSITTIGDSTFASCWALTNIVIPNSVSTIGDFAFDDCRGATSVTVGTGVTVIGNHSFDKCSSLISISFRSLVAPKYVGSYWLLDTPAGIIGHALAASNFPQPGGSLMGLTMGTVLSANPTVPGVSTTPSAPQGLTATFVDQNVTLTWTPPAENGGSSILSYDIYRGSTGVEYAKIGTVPATTLTYLDRNGTSENSSYYVVAVNAVGTGARADVQSRTVSPSFIQEALPPVAAVAVGSLIAFFAFWVVSRTSETAVSVANGIDSVRAYLRRLFRLDKLFDFISGYFKGRAHSLAWKQVEKVELESTKAVQRPPLFAGFSALELAAILFTSVFLGLAFMITNKIDIGSLDDWLIYILVAGLAVIIHDLVHRYMAWRHNVPTEYKFWFLGTIIMFLTALAFGVVYSSPSRLAIEDADKMTARQQAVVYGSGPIISVILFGLFLALIPLGGAAATIGKLGASMNLLTAAYAMMPFAPMDGLKVYKWKRWAWAALFVPILVTYFAMIIYVL